MLAIIMNNCGVADICALCGAPVDPEVGPGLFMAHIMAHIMAHTLARVCRECGLRYEPSLVRMLDMYAAAEAMVLARLGVPGEAF